MEEFIATKNRLVCQNNVQTPSVPHPQPLPKPQEITLPKIATVVLPAGPAPPDQHGTTVESGDLAYFSSDDTDPDINEFFNNLNSGQCPRQWEGRIHHFDDSSRSKQND